jgi:hypothetical protein
MMTVNTSLTDVVRGLELPAGEYTIFGESALAVRGLRSVTTIELLVTGDLLDELGRRGWEPVPGDERSLRRGDLMARDSVRVGLHRPRVAHLISRSEEIDGVAVASRFDVQEYLDQQRAQQHREQAAAQRWTGNGWTFLAGVVQAPRPTFEAARGTSFWALAYALGCVMTGLGVVGQVRADEADAAIAVVVPFLAALALLAAWIIAAVAVRVCNGDRSITRATASQAAIVSSVVSLPSTVTDLATTNPAAGLVASLVVVVAMVWMTGVLYSAAFDCGVGRGIGGQIVGLLALAGILLLLFVVLAVVLLAAA